MDATVLLRTEQSADRIGIVEVTVPGGWPGPPLHHHAFDEAFYVLSGELTFQLGDALARAGAGTFAFAPGGMQHTLANLGPTEARYLLLITPGGFERYFDPGAGTAPIPETIVVGGRLAERDDLESARSLAPAGDAINVLARGAQSAERISIMENVASPDFPGPRLHHHAFDEL